MANPPRRPDGVGRPGTGRRAEQEIDDAWDPGSRELQEAVDGWEREKTEAHRLRQRLEQLQREAAESPYPPITTPGQAVQVVVGTTERKRDSEAPKSNRQRAGEALQTPAGKLAAALLTAALSGGGVSVAMSSQRQHEPATDAGAQAYALCKSELERQAGEITRLSKQLGEFQGFFYGYLRATGVEVPLPPGSPPPAKVEIQTVPDPKAEVAPVMAAPRRGGVPRPARLRVLTEPPVAPAAPRPPDLPELLPGAQR